MLNRYKTAEWTYSIRSTAFQPWQPPITLSTENIEEMASVNHFPLNVDGDDGGPWRLHKSWDIPVLATPPDATFTNFRGSFTCQLPAGFSPLGGGSYSEVSTSEMNSRGTTAIARSEPTDSVATVSTAIAEQVGVALPYVSGATLWKSQAALANRAGDEYLNVQFGWLPLVSDIQKFLYAVRNANQIIQSYKAGSGQKTRVGYAFPSSQATAVVTAGNILPWPAAVNKFGSGFIEETRYEATWFKGCFKYHVPVATGQVDKIAEYASYADKLLGLRITPEVLWNAAPWSWAADWFGTTGDVLHNISALGHDGLVMQYGYVMNERSYARRIAATFTANNGTKWTVSRRVLDSWKKRTQATPYGFGIDLHALSAKQTAILVALGLTKGLPGHPQ